MKSKMNGSIPHKNVGVAASQKFGLKCLKTNKILVTAQIPWRDELASFDPMT